MTALVVALIALLAGPVIYQLVYSRPQLHRALDLGVSVIIGGLVILLLVHTIGVGGLPTLLFAMSGFAVPPIAERLVSGREKAIHGLTLTLGVAGLLLHSAVDGAALMIGATQGEPALQLAVLAHRLPSGMAVWWLVRTGFGTRSAIIAIALMAIATIAGYSLGSMALGVVGDVGRAWFMAFVAGSLVHLAIHRIGHHDHSDHID